MKFIVLRKADADTEAGIFPGDDLIMAMGRYNEEMIDEGVFVDGQGLQPSDKGARITFTNGMPVVTDGPFAETKELVAGFTIFHADSRTEAIERLKRWPALDGGGNVTLELRQLYELEDFAASEGIELHRDLQQRLDVRPSSLCTYLFFNGQCAQALHYYADCLGGTIEMMMTHGEAPDPSQVSEDWHDKIMHGQLRIGDGLVMAADAPPEYEKQPQGFSIHVEIADPGSAERVFQRLAEKGEVRMPFAQTFWAYRFGMLVDRFGISWMISCADPGSAAQAPVTRGEKQ